MPNYPTTDHPTQDHLDRFKRLFPEENTIQQLQLADLINHIQTLDMDVLPPLSTYREKHEVFSPCTMAIAGLIWDCIVVVTDFALIRQALSDNAMARIAPLIRGRENLLRRLAAIIQNPQSTKVERAGAVVRILFALEILNGVTMILKLVWKGFLHPLSGIFFALKLMAKLTLALATDGATLIASSLAATLVDGSRVVLKAKDVFNACPATEGLGEIIVGGPGQAQLHNLLSIAVDSSGNLYTLEGCLRPNNTRVQKWAPKANTGTTIIQGEFFRAGWDMDTLYGSCNLTTDQNGNLYLLFHLPNRGGIRVFPMPINERAFLWVKHESEGGKATLGNYIHPTSIAVDHTGNVYVYEENQVLKITNRIGNTAIDGVYRIGTTIIDGVIGKGIAVDRVGNVYICLADRVMKYAPGNKTGVIVAGGNGHGSGASQLNYPQAIDVDSSGNLYIADSDNRRVQLWEPGSTVGVTVAIGGNTPDQSIYPTDLVFFNKSIYVCDSWNNRVQKWALG
jgi:NHL repeat